MISITDITDCLVVRCPKCGVGHLIKEWGVRKCNFEGCDGEFELQYNLEIATQLLEIAAKELADYRKPKPVSKFVLPTLHRFPNGDVIAIP